MKKSRRVTWALAGLTLLALTLGLGSASGGATAKGPTNLDQALLQKLKETARGSVAVSTKKGTKFVAFLGAGRNGDLYPKGGASKEAKAREFVREFGPLLGASGADADLVQTDATTDALGSTHVTYEQRHNGLPVFGGVVKAHVDDAGNLTSVNGTVVPDIEVDTSPRLDASAAAARAIAAVAADPPENASGVATPVSVLSLQAASTSHEVYRTGLTRGVEGSNQLVYVVDVTNGSSIRDLVFVNAHVGKLVNRYSLVHDALFRRLFEGQGTPQNPLPPIQIWQEGQSTAGLNTNQLNIVNFSGDSYRFFFNTWARDSYDGAGAEMRSVNNDPTIACPNANWNGLTTNYCNGVTSDDVVAHEWGHAYTEYTHGLIYQWQPGALNESYSDIWGEVVDMINGAGTDAPAGVRSVNACSTHTTPAPLLVINSPEQRVCAAGGAAFGPPLTFAGLTDNVVLALDGVGTFPGPPPAPDTSTTNGCLPPFTNAAQIAGNIALIDRGVCGFAVKVKNAQNAGAVGVVVVNNTGTAPCGMAGVDPTITIPSLCISLPNGNIIKGFLAAGQTVNVTMRLSADPAASEDSYRWLMGEDSTAFGGAIRDMWSPTCLADPGKVTDAEYHCDTSDAGGVHTNSGVPNHGFALLVDGGTFNGRTISPLGLVKAAHVYWRAQSVYQVPATDFADHADALERSCQDLIGQPLLGLSTGGGPATPSGQSISAADCAEVADMIAAVELRTDVTDKCNFTSLLDPNTPPACAGTKNPPTFFKEDFNQGLRGWTTTNQGVFSGWPGTNWVADSSLPADRPGTAAYAENLDGQCTGGAGDVSGVMRLESPSIKLPSGAVHSYRLGFTHYIASELGWDGGNVKLSINGGAYALVPSTAFFFNPYNATLQTAAAGNTNPLAGQPAFTGTDGGQVTGSWGQSFVDLSLLGVKPGDTVRLRFDFGMDGCTGIDGWYVDDITVSACNASKE
ncbi:MAG TPA: M4 family metallopeptidase, partial [Desertimonas sp.]|nr:M4 family metallopeptidase [Desertimonas sp.]